MSVYVRMYVRMWVVEEKCNVQRCECLCTYVGSGGEV